MTAHHIVLSLLSITFSVKAYGYPELARNGYVNCNSCHLSATGGGILSDYGRELSREILPMWKSDDEKSKEHLFAYGVMGDPEESPINKWLKMSGEYRSVYFHEDTKFYKKDRFLFMQGDLNAALIFGKWMLVGSAGVTQLRVGQNLEFIARTHYLQYSFDDEYHLRVGKFVSAYGINTPDHVTLTRGRLSLGNHYEAYHFEAGYVSQKYNLFLTALLGRPDKPALQMRKGVAAQGAYVLNEQMKIGVNALHDSNDIDKRTLIGAFGMIGFTPKLTLLSDTSLQLRTPNAQAQQTGLLSTQKLSYEAVPGLWVYGLQEYGITDFKRSLSNIEVYGLGFQFFPRTHFELNVAYEKAKYSILGFDDYAWIMTHFYL